MSKQITTSPSNRKISALYKDIKRENLILQPDFQRRFVWNNKHKEKFIDTILEGYPVPEIYVAQRGIDIETIESEEVVVDGQQRLHTIVEYIDEPEESTVFGNIVKKYRNLSKDEIQTPDLLPVIRAHNSSPSFSVLYFTDGEVQR